MEEERELDKAELFCISWTYPSLITIYAWSVNSNEYNGCLSWRDSMVGMWRTNLANGEQLSSAYTEEASITLDGRACEILVFLNNKHNSIYYIPSFFLLNSLQL